MPEQPPDPLHYEMKIPPEPPKQKGPEKPPSDEKEAESNTARDTGSVRRPDQPQSGRDEK
jgi:hypothetical protein